jgi:hypothetical protein
MVREEKRPEYSQADANGMSDVTQCDVIPQVSRKAWVFHEKPLLSRRDLSEQREKNSSLLTGKARSRDEKWFRQELFPLFLFSSCTVVPDKCVTSDRSVDELLMRSHFFTLHRRLSKRDRFSAFHQCFHYAFCILPPRIHSRPAGAFSFSRSLASADCQCVHWKKLWSWDEQLKWKNTKLEWKKFVF